MAERPILLRRAGACVLAGLLATLLAGANPAAHAAPLSPPPTFLVNSADDVAAAAPLNNGICETAPHGGFCTLRAAIEKANNYPGGGVIILLPALTGGAEYLLTIGQLTITNSLTLSGGGAAHTIIDASGIASPTRVLITEPPAIVTISGVTVQGGHAGFTEGGGLFVTQNSTLTLNNSRVTSNSVGYAGGGIYNNYATLTVTNSLIDHNFAGNDGGGIADPGGVMALAGVTVSHNTSTYGGGIATSGPQEIKIVASAINDNGGLDGGGIYNQASSLVILNTTLSGNAADNSGGGIYNEYTARAAAA